MWILCRSQTQGSREILTCYFPCVSTRVQPGLSQTGTISSPNFGSNKKVGLFREPSLPKETQNTEVPGTKSRVFMLRENTKFPGLETNLHGKDLEIAYRPVVWKCVRWTGCSRHWRRSSCRAWRTHTGAIEASAPRSSRNWRKMQPGGAKKTQTE